MSSFVCVASNCDVAMVLTINACNQMVIAEYYKMVSNTKGSDFIFDEN